MLRPEDMNLLLFYINKDTAKRMVYKIGEERLVHFLDLNTDSRRDSLLYASEIRDIERIVSRIMFLEEETKDFVLSGGVFRACSSLNDKSRVDDSGILYTEVGVSNGKNVCDDNGNLKGGIYHSNIKGVVANLDNSNIYNNNASNLDNSNRNNNNDSNLDNSNRYNNNASNLDNSNRNNNNASNLDNSNRYNNNASNLDNSNRYNNNASNLDYTNNLDNSNRYNNNASNLDNSNRYNNNASNLDNSNIYNNNDSNLDNSNRYNNNASNLDYTNNLDNSNRYNNNTVNSLDNVNNLDNSIRYKNNNNSNLDNTKNNNNLGSLNNFGDTYKNNNVNNLDDVSNLDNSNINVESVNLNSKFLDTNHPATNVTETQIIKTSALDDDVSLVDDENLYSHESFISTIDHLNRHYNRLTHLIDIKKDTLERIKEFTTNLLIIDTLDDHLCCEKDLEDSKSQLDFVCFNLDKEKGLVLERVLYNSLRRNVFCCKKTNSLDDLLVSLKKDEKGIKNLFSNIGLYFNANNDKTNNIDENNNEININLTNNIPNIDSSNNLKNINSTNNNVTSTDLNNNNLKNIDSSNNNATNTDSVNNNPSNIDLGNNNSKNIDPGHNNAINTDPNNTDPGNTDPGNNNALNTDPDNNNLKNINSSNNNLKNIGSSNNLKNIDSSNNLKNIDSSNNNLKNINSSNNIKNINSSNNNVTSTDSSNNNLKNIDSSNNNKINNAMCTTNDNKINSAMCTINDNKINNTTDLISNNRFSTSGTIKNDVPNINLITRNKNISELDGFDEFYTKKSYHDANYTSITGENQNSEYSNSSMSTIEIVSMLKDIITIKPVTAYVLFTHGHNAMFKIRHIVSSLGGYPIDDVIVKQGKMGLTSILSQLLIVYQNNETALMNERARIKSLIMDWKYTVNREYRVYQVMNMFIVGSNSDCLVGQGFVLKNQMKRIKKIFKYVNRQGGSCSFELIKKYTYSFKRIKENIDLELEDSNEDIIHANEIKEKSRTNGEHINNGEINFNYKLKSNDSNLSGLNEIDESSENENAQDSEKNINLDNKENNNKIVDQNKGIVDQNKGIVDQNKGMVDQNINKNRINSIVDQNRIDSIVDQNTNKNKNNGIVDQNRIDSIIDQNSNNKNGNNSIVDQNTNKNKNNGIVDQNRIDSIIDQNSNNKNGNNSIVDQNTIKNRNNSIVDHNNVVVDPNDYDSMPNKNKFSNNDYKRETDSKHDSNGITYQTSHNNEYDSSESELKNLNEYKSTKNNSDIAYIDQYLNESNDNKDIDNINNDDDGYKLSDYISELENSDENKAKDDKISELRLKKEISLEKERCITRNDRGDIVTKSVTPHQIIQSPTIEIPKPKTVEIPREPPTYFTLNKFTTSFQDICNVYGIPKFGEINPAIFYITTLPFMFGIMFGDFGHGLIILTISLYMIIKEKTLKPPESIAMVFAGRYILLLCSLWSLFFGIIYSDFLSLPISLFESSYKKEDGTITKMENYTYPLGIDPAWHHSESNGPAFINSLKMKLSIIIGFFHMTLGIGINFANVFYLRDRTTLFCVLIPQTLSYFCFVGYLISLIYFKWIQGIKNVSLISVLVGMFTNPFNIENEIYPYQQKVQLLLFCIIIISMPWMFFSKPLYKTIKRFKVNKKKRKNEEEEGNENGNRNENNHNDESNKKYIYEIQDNKRNEKYDDEIQDNKRNKKYNDEINDNTINKKYDDEIQNNKRNKKYNDEIQSNKRNEDYIDQMSKNNRTRKYDDNKRNENDNKRNDNKRNKKYNDQINDNTRNKKYNDEIQSNKRNEDYIDQMQDNKRNENCNDNKRNDDDNKRNDNDNKKNDNDNKRNDNGKRNRKPINQSSDNERNKKYNDEIQNNNERNIENDYINYKPKKLLQKRDFILKNEPPNNETIVDIWIHSIIETIEFGIGLISNTSSYLRLWAISLAHYQLTKVLHSLTIGNPESDLFKRIYTLIIYIPVTFGLLIGLEGLSSCLHALRLNWIEFNGKFFKGGGYMFQPLNFDIEENQN